MSVEFLYLDADCCDLRLPDTADAVPEENRGIWINTADIVLVEDLHSCANVTIHLRNGWRIRVDGSDEGDMVQFFCRQRMVVVWDEITDQGQ